MRKDALAKGEKEKERNGNQCLWSSGYHAT